MKKLQANGFHFYEEGRKWLARGVTYGPFRPDAQGCPYPPKERMYEDFCAMAQAGVNALRLYELPSEALVCMASECNLRLFIDLPWTKHVDIYSNAQLKHKSLEMAREALLRIRDWPNVGAVVLGNEIPGDIVRWSGTARVSTFLRQLYEMSRELAPGVLAGYANYPSTEYLPVGFCDFVGFNVYLHDPVAFGAYVRRLRHLYPHVPVLLSEFGVDSLQEGLPTQARLMNACLTSAYEAGLAGAFVFSWTDEWHSGGFDMTRWAFGLVDSQRCPKPALQPASHVFFSAPQPRYVASPKVSVVVATYNGGSTLGACIESLKSLHYPDYEIIVVDDGSSDDTADILARVQGVRVVSHENRGLSSARNSGIAAARGEIVAFTDSDCVADPDWLYHLVLCLLDLKCAGVGGPNLTPPEPGVISKCIALAPGHATHVLLEPTVAEHVPGCNMAFRRDVLVELGGFDPTFRKAGDDVDVIWRLQDAGYSMGFSCAAFVWHYRRTTVKAYLRQQVGYGQAEALLIGKHPNRFNDRGQSRWRGTIYPELGYGAEGGSGRVHYGVFGSAGYQCVYPSGEGNLFWFFLSLEWWAMSLAFVAAGVFSARLLTIGLVAVVTSTVVSGAKALWRWKAARRPPPAWAFPLLWLLWVSQPLARGAARYVNRMKLTQTGGRMPEGVAGGEALRRDVIPRAASGVEYWSESGQGRLELLRRLCQEMTSCRWVFTANSGWEPWDLSIGVSWWFRVVVTTLEENHGQEKHLVRVRYRLAPSSLLWLVGAAGGVASALVAWQNTLLARWGLSALLLLLWAGYRRSALRRAAVCALADSVATKLGLCLIHHRQKVGPEPDVPPGQGEAKPADKTSRKQVQ